MQTISFSATSVAANTSGFATGVTGATWVIEQTSTDDGLGHTVTITNNTGNSHASKTVVLAGRNVDGGNISETLSLPAGNATVTSTKSFAKLLSAVPSATIGADTMDIGWSANSVFNWVRVSDVAKVFNVGFGCSVDGGSPTYTIQHSYGGNAVFNHPVVAAQTVSKEGVYTSPVRNIRLAFSEAGTVSVVILQAGA